MVSLDQPGNDLCPHGRQKRSRMGLELAASPGREPMANQLAALVAESTRIPSVSGVERAGAVLPCHRPGLLAAASFSDLVFDPPARCRAISVGPYLHQGRDRTYGQR